jgi:hypothetical protein
VRKRGNPTKGCFRTVNAIGHNDLKIRFSATLGEESEVEVALV